MKALLVTSEITFVPDNYAAMVQGMADCPQIGGLMIIKNTSFALVYKALGLMLAGAPRFGMTLLKNYFKGSKKHDEAYRSAGKPVWKVETVNSEEALGIIRESKFDLVVNARTRYIYKRPILELPPLGCINIHHGLLPEQRGLMCDLWALSEGRPAGFTIHKMNQNIDDGNILEKAVVSDGSEHDFMRYVEKAAKVECETLKNFLERIERQGMPQGVPNLAPEKLIMRKTPAFKQIRMLTKKGLKL